MKISTFLCLLLAIQAQIDYQSYFQKIPGSYIGTNLAQEADDAVNYLSTYLNINFNCPSNAPNMYTQSAYGLPSVAFQCYNPLPNGYFNMGMVPYMQKYSLYNQLRNIISILSNIKQSMNGNNWVVGNGNSVRGSNNVVIGSNNFSNGKSNWILASNYASRDADDGVLVLNNYMIQLANYYKVIQDPSLVVKCVFGKQAAQLINTFWNNANRRYDVRS